MLQVITAATAQWCKKAKETTSNNQKKHT